MANQNLEGRTESAWYNTEKGIRKSSGHLTDFNRLLDERHKAGYKRRERLNEFYVLDGKYLLDSCGNCMKSDEPISGKAPDTDCLTPEQYWRHRGDKMTSFSMDSNVPPADLKCKHCGDGWDMKNIDDTVVRNETKVIPLNELVGWRLGQVKKLYSDRIDAVYRMQPDILIRNDSNIDLSPKYPQPQQEWQKGMVKNETGWVGDREGVTDDYTIQEGDEGFFNVWTFLHKECSREDLKESYEQKFRQLFEDAGFRDVKLAATKNDYCGCDHCAPWYKVTTEHGTIKIGVRKRVINIDWGGIAVKDIGKLFKEEDVTKGASSIHAWGWDKAKDYLTRINDALK